MKKMQNVPEQRNEVDIKAAKDYFNKTIMPMLMAQKKAEKNGEDMFTCVICGGVANWGRAKGNNHLHIYCSGCGFRLVE